MTYLRNLFGATPLDSDDIDGLIPFHITTQSELNEWEQANIIEAEQDIASVRRQYITALKSADQHDYLPLIRFVRS